MIEEYKWIQYITCFKVNSPKVKTKCPKWLDILWKGKIVQINSKGKIREKKEKRNSRRKS